MSRTTDCMYRASEALSEVMDNIGVNERLVMKRRTAWLLMENIRTHISVPLCNGTAYNFGSQSEGSTTIGLESDRDFLVNMNTHNIIQNMSERKPLLVNLMMIQHEKISPGYCYLQLIRPDLTLPAAVSDIDNETMKCCVTKGGGRFLLKNTFATSGYDQINYHGRKHIHGPALTFSEPKVDLVTSFCCESSPHQVISWLQKQRGSKWPTEDVLEKCRKVGCFVVPVSSKVSYEPELEWRISTCLQERYLMFSLNITQLRCYILMKMILKTHISPHVEDVLSSFMWKNVLLHCIANSSHDWHTGNLLSYLHLCLFMLKECVEQRNCPHFMIPENNLLAGCITDKQRGEILDIINNLMINNEQLLFKIQFDDLGNRLMKFTEHEVNGQDILTATEISQKISCDLLYHTAGSMSGSFTFLLTNVCGESLELAQENLFKTLKRLEMHELKGELIRLCNACAQIPLVSSTLGSLLASPDIASHTAISDEALSLPNACALLIPLVSSTLGSVLASSNIASHMAISDEAFTYLEAGKESDALSGRLKLASVLYCTGDMNRTECELRNIQNLYNMSLVETVCVCKIKLTPYEDKHIWKACADNNEVSIKSLVAVCTRFLQYEINCVPQELRYEILGSHIDRDRQMATDDDSQCLWFVDSIPYLYFLQYKTYGHLQRRTEQQDALFNLAQSINFEANLGHKETALNLLGQCMEQENMQTAALHCYIQSLKHCVRNNVASFLLCIQLFKIWKQDNAQ